MRKWFSFLLALAILLSLGAGCWADDTDPVRFIQAVTASETDKNMVIYVDAPETTNGQYSVDLGGVLLEGTTHTIEESDVPITYFCLVDLSGTMYGTEGLEGFPINLAKKTMKGISSRMRDKDHMVIATFENDIDISSVYTKGDKLDDAIDALTVTNKDTNLYTAITESIEQLSTSKEYDTKKCLIILSDGADLQANGETSAEVLETIKKVDFPIYTVATMFATSQLEGGKVMGSFARASAGGEHFGTAAESGAQGINYQASGDDFGKAIHDDMMNGRLIVADLSGYVLTDDRNEITLTVTFNSLDDGTSITDTKSLIVDELPIERQTTEQPKIKLGMIIGICCGVAVLAAAITVYLLQRKKKEEEAAAAAAAAKAAAWEARKPGDVIPPVSETHSGAVNVVEPPQPPVKPVQKARATDVPVSMVQIPYGKNNVSFGIGSNGDQCTVGRTSKSDVVLNGKDGKLSGRHFTLVCSKGSYFIKDENSTNGTFVNGVNIAGKGWAKINSGDNVRAGETEYRIMFGADVHKR